MLKHIPAHIPPDLVKAMMDMGHGDTLVIADANFPAASYAKRLIRCDGSTLVDMLDGILSLFPTDRADDAPFVVMALRNGEDSPPIWGRYAEIIKSREDWTGEFGQVERFAFYERAAQAFAVVITGDTSYKGNLIIKKGSIR